MAKLRLHKHLLKMIIKPDTLEQEIFLAEDRENLKLEGLADNKKGGANAPPFDSGLSFIQ